MMRNGKYLLIAGMFWGIGSLGAATPAPGQGSDSGATVNQVDINAYWNSRFDNLNQCCRGCIAQGYERFFNYYLGDGFISKKLPFITTHYQVKFNAFFKLLMSNPIELVGVLKDLNVIEAMRNALKIHICSSVDKMHKNFSSEKIAAEIVTFVGKLSGEYFHPQGDFSAINKDECLFFMITMCKIFDFDSVQRAVKSRYVDENVFKDTFVIARGEGVDIADLLRVLTHSHNERDKSDPDCHMQ